MNIRKLGFFFSYLPVLLNLTCAVQSFSIFDTFLLLLLVSVSYTKVQVTCRLNFKYRYI